MFNFPATIIFITRARWERVLVDAHLQTDDGSMAQGGLKKRSEKFSVASKSAKAKSSKHNKPLGPKKGGRSRPG